MHPRGYPALTAGERVAALSLFIPGDPIPKGRPRTRISGVRNVGPGLWQGKPFAQVYTDPKTREWEEHVEATTRRQLLALSRVDDGRELTLPFRGRVLVTLRFNVARPKSAPKRVIIPIAARGDVDNMAKSVIDGIANAGVMANDRLITDLSCTRRYADADHPEGVEADLTGYY